MINGLHGRISVVDDDDDDCDDGYDDDDDDAALLTFCFSLQVTTLRKRVEELSKL